MSGASASIAGASSTLYGQYKVPPFDTPSGATRSEPRQSNLNNKDTRGPLARSFQPNYDQVIDDTSSINNEKNGQGGTSSSHYTVERLSRTTPVTSSSSSAINMSTVAKPSTTTTTTTTTTTDVPPAAPPPLHPASIQNNKTKPITAKTKNHTFADNALASIVPLREGKLGPHKDGRVRNPVPRKLKGKTDDKNGNFAVMHMDMTGTQGASPVPRAEAAQRTSENTANAARTAQKEGYVPMKKRKVLATPPDPVPPQQLPDPELFKSPEMIYGPAARGNHTLSDFANKAGQRRSMPLSAQETKSEQARLLTLLRTITPIQVVDHICTGLAFFGGIPGAPPPEDGVFPESAQANGSGRLFIGWLSELFPSRERREIRDEETERTKRPRGRPKGSKATKARKDKGIKKGPKNRHDDTGDSDPEDDDDEGDSNIDVGNGSASHPNPSTNDGHFGTSASYQPPMTTAALRNVSMDENQSDMSPTMANMGKRRPGKQKGDDENDQEPTTMAPSSASHTHTYNFPSRPNNSGPSQASSSAAPNHFHMPTQEPQTNSSTTTSMPNGTSQVMPPTSQSAHQAAPVPVLTQSAKRNRAKAATKKGSQGIEPDNVSTYTNHASSSSLPQEVTSSQIISVPPITGDKKKRNRAKAAKESMLPAPPVTQPESAGSTGSNLPVASGHLQTALVSGRESPIPPPPKRQRKQKDSPLVTHNNDKIVPPTTGSPLVNNTPAPAAKGLQHIQPSTISPLSHQMQASQSFMSKPLGPFSQPLPQFHSSGLPKTGTPLQQQFPRSEQSATPGHQQSPLPQQHVMNNNSSQSQSLTTQQPSMHKPMSMSMMYDPNPDVSSSASSQQSSMNQMAQLLQPTPLQQSSNSLDFNKSASQPLLSAGLPQAPTHIMPSTSMPSNMVGLDSLLSTSRPQSTRPITSRSSAQGLDTNYDHFGNMQYDTPPQNQSHQHRLSLSNNSHPRVSPIPNPILNPSMGSSLNPTLNSSAFFQSQPSQHHQNNRQLSSQSPFNQSNFPPSNPYIGHSQAPINNNLYRTNQPQLPIHSPFSPRQPSLPQHQPQQQQHSQQPYYNFTENTAMDLPGLDTLTPNPLSNSNPSNLNQSLATGGGGMPTYGGQSLHNRAGSGTYNSLSGTSGGLGNMSSANGMGTLPHMSGGGGPSHHQQQQHQQQHPQQHDFMSGAGSGGGGGGPGTGTFDLFDRDKRGMNAGLNGLGLGGRR